MAHLTRLRICAVLTAIGLAGCSPPAVSNPERDAAPGESASAPYELPQPKITMEATPPPPHTYWAPEGATIRNHPHVPGIWLAFVDGRNVASYYGDQCRASEYQRFIGEPLLSIAPPPPGMEERRSCEGCPVNADLRPDRVNVIFDNATQTIVQVACY